MITTCNLMLKVKARTLVENLNWQIDPGQCWSVIGRNGAGKSTLLRALAGLREPDAGTIAINQRLLLPAAVLAGGSLLVIADTLARTLVAPQQLPVGVLTSMIGAPVFLYQLHQLRRKR